MFVGKQLKAITANNKRGDTIVEVLMSIAIVGAVITGAYALASRSLAEGISAAEHATAIKMAQTQVETLKSRQIDAAANTPLWDATYNIVGATINPDKNNYCLNNTATAMLDASGAPAANWVPQKNGGAGFTGNNLKVGTGTDDYAAICTRDANGAVGASNTAKYFMNVRMIPTSNLPTYLITVRWNPAGKGPASQSQLYFRF
jgi:type II secretory pathway pseudopilin PulG